VPHPRGIPQYEVGHAGRLRAIEERLRSLEGLHLTGNAYRGVAVPDVVADARRVAGMLRRDLPRRCYSSSIGSARTGSK
jgi:oxygen-dependent protoporphyrinogen oxidase